MRPWREIVLPHPDVLEGTFQQSEFAADITAVRRGRAPREYQDAAAFFERTFITEGMRLLLTQVAQRLAGRGGEPVIQLQTAFGGGKTHTMLAVYHLATHRGPLADLPGIPALIDAAGLLNLPQARVAILDGTAHAPGQPWQQGSQSVRTLWGELAWQLGGRDGYDLLADADHTGTSPGKDLLVTLLAQYAPCVILIDELVAYIRQFADAGAQWARLSGGTYDSNLSFVQALTEAAKLVPNAIVLASLPESEVEAGSSLGIAALRALEKTFGRVQALWKPVATEEAFEIVRRRLFEPVRDPAARDQVCRAFADLYISEGAKLPAETQEGRYLDRLRQAYPIHPEVFDRLYEDWTTIDGFQRTRGVLKLMAKVIYRLWQDDNQDRFILPSSLPLHDGSTRNELTYYLPPGWDPVIEADIDGPRAETTELESREPRFGQIQAARRVARTLFFGSAPASVITKSGSRGLDRARVLLGCLQPGQASAVYLDALTRLADRLHYLNSTGDQAADSARFWFDTRANLRREMEDRKRRFDDKTAVRSRLESAVQQALAGSLAAFDGLHIFTPHADVPDDAALRLIALPPEAWYAREESRHAFDIVGEYLRSNGARPRYRANRLLFLAPDHAILARLRDAARVALAWDSIVSDVQEGRLNIDQAQRRQAEQEAKSAAAALPRVARECYRWLLCPVLETPAAPVTIEAFSVSTAGGAAAREIERVCADHELIISAWSPVHLRAILQEFYWPSAADVVEAHTVWEDTLRYLYLPRLRSRGVFDSVITSGAAGRDFFATALGQTGERFDGFRFGSPPPVVASTLRLISPTRGAEIEEQIRQAEAARAAAQAAAIAEKNGVDSYVVEERANDTPPTGNGPIVRPQTVNTGGNTGGSTQSGGGNPPPQPKARVYHASAIIPALAAKQAFTTLADEIIALLAGDPNAEVTLTLEISARFPQGVGEQIKRAVSENAAALKLRHSEWE